ncbi:hypothetical protein ILUMI_05959 [Ignelater luminosus]|uniref:PiggyBac transposable element-derived protein domain-containing protein n=1 Tax=Ignelater luminosus TaxID=2038154 RepID=A0A8K0DAY8_IGNLU|nr:hypothetical protein ILUMI_05959 [Ignelater luminosus]
MEIKALKGLLGMTGVYKVSHQSNRFGIEIFRLAMSIQRFRCLLRCIRFDDKTTREIRRETDKFAAIRDVFESFAHNCETAYHMPEFVTIDEMRSGKLNKKKEDIQCAQILQLMGDEALSFVPKKSVHFERYKFLTHKQTTEATEQLLGHNRYGLVEPSEYAENTEPDAVLLLTQQNDSEENQEVELEPAEENVNYPEQLTDDVRSNGAGYH